MNKDLLQVLRNLLNNGGIINTLEDFHIVYRIVNQYDRSQPQGDALNDLRQEKVKEEKAQYWGRTKSA